MNGHAFTLAGARLVALPSGALHWPDEALLCVSDLHLGKSGRRARLGEACLPPYEVRDTLARLERDLAATGARTVVCLGDSFDDDQAVRDLPDAEKAWITTLQAGRRWVWIEGNHDPGPVELGGTHLAELPAPPLSFRHIAQQGQSGEVSGHYHPKTTIRLRGRSLSRACFLVDADRVIMPAYGTYTGGLRTTAPVLTALMRPEAVAILTGSAALPVPLAQAG
ncbi:ligase-associated DNA damage response endonuclease PdeM [Roseovarius sp. SCSIO 43702]|uniref:ligase-associated DNA damage response endonuclease PdeM n=1 Tax=Roseovarius sp. SCSIO 43702 TaxID=2823043 RepID=UPI001C73BF52|nr:ligase-associated DNA damage response endonuclease PdeM [Roseovarius sp. SCSIO 43702]QYX57454.1 ligase-associated DNA damage response endonuclease PdeM [Roseovarius sp. SCSIO 43702]